MFDIVGKALHAVADVSGEILGALPLDIQQKTNLGLALEGVHAIAADLDAAIEGVQPGGITQGLSIEEVVKAVTEALAPQLVTLVSQLVQKELAALAPPAKVE